MGADSFGSLLSSMLFRRGILIVQEIDDGAKSSYTTPNIFSLFVAWRLIVCLALLDGVSTVESRIGHCKWILLEVRKW